MSSQLRFKIATPSGELRRLRFDSIPTWTQFQQHLESNLLHGKNSNEVIVQYIDEEGDKVSIGSQEEWHEALDVLAETSNKTRVLKLFVVLRSQSSAQQKVQPSAQCQQVQSLIEQLIQTFLSSSSQNEGLRSLIQQVLQPSTLETFVAQLPLLFLNETSKFANNQTRESSNEKKEEVKQEPPRFPFECRRRGFPHPRGGPWKFMNCPGRRPFETPLQDEKVENQPQPFQQHRRHHTFFHYHLLNRRGIHLLTEKNYPAAKECFEELIKIAPSYNVAIYNLACTYSLISAQREGEEKEEMQVKAIETLRKAIECGYSNHAHMESDADFEPIRARPEFIEILASLKQQRAPKPQQQQQESKPEPVPVPEQQPEPVNIPEQQQEEPSPKESEFDAELKQLEDMGFTDRERNLELLRSNRGDLGRVLARLLD